MKCWYDEQAQVQFCEPNCVDEWLQLIWTVGVDYDGCKTVGCLKSLVDELVDMAKKARECLHQGSLFSTNVKLEDDKL